MRNIDYLLPDIKMLQEKLLIDFKKEFLKINKLKLGDKVTLPFSFERIIYDNKRKQNKVTFDKPAEGILKEDERGALIAESVEEFIFYKYKSGYVKGKWKEWYESERRKSIFKFGTGFIH